MQYITWTVTCLMKNEHYSEDCYKKLYNFQMSCPVVFSDATNRGPPSGKTQWTRIWANSKRQWRTEGPDGVQSTGSQKRWHDLATEQQWKGNAMQTLLFSELTWNLQDLSKLGFLGNMHLITHPTISCQVNKTNRDLPCLLFTSEFCLDVHPSHGFLLLFFLISEGCVLMRHR